MPVERLVTRDAAPRPAPALSVVIPTLDESECIGRVLREIGDALQDLPSEIIVVDDSADERTAAVVRAHAAGDPRIRLIRRPGERGLAAAAIAGFAAAEGEVLGLIDGDGQHDPALLPRLYAAFRAQAADFAVASRYAGQGGTGLTGLRHWISEGGTRLTRRLLGAPTTDPLSGLFLVRRGWFEAARPKLSGVGFKILVDLLWSGPGAPQVAELAGSLRERHAGRSKLDLRVVAELGALLVEKRSAGLVPARFALFAGVGASGVVVHLAALAAVGAATAAPFWLAQALAIWAAMTWNFHLNNALTFRDHRLGGRDLWRGLVSFYLACGSGALLSEASASLLFLLGLPATLAGIGGIVAAAFWNYASVKSQTWGPGRPLGNRSAAGATQAALPPRAG